MMPTERNLPDKVYVNSQNIQISLKLFINRHRSILHQLMEQNQKLAQHNSVLNGHVCDHEGTILMLNQRIANGEKEIEKYKEEQTELKINEKLLRSQMMAFRNRCAESMISSEKMKEELQQVIDKLQQELKEHDENKRELKNELDVIRKELQAKQNECDTSNEELVNFKAEINANKQQLAELEKALTNLQEELKQKDELINKIREEQANYKIETKKNINKMQEIQRIFYPNAANPLPPRQESNSIRSLQPTSVTVQPRPHSRTVLKRSSLSSSSESDSGDDNAELLRGWEPPRNNDLLNSVEIVQRIERTSTDIPPTPETIEPPRRKRYRH